METKGIREEVREILNSSFEIRISDYRDYDPEGCNNGGSYAFYETYKKLHNNKWEVRYTTSSDFPYCDQCGTFGACCCEPEDGYRTMSTEELIDIIIDWLKKTDVFIYADDSCIKDEDQFIDEADL